MDITVVGSAPPERVQELRRLLEGKGSLATVVRALDGLGLAFDEIIPMDEYTLDLLVTLPDDLTLVFDTT